MTSLVWTNIRKRKTRSAVCVAAVGIGIALLLVLTGLCRGMVKESAARIRKTGAQVIVQPRGSSGLLALKGSSLPVKYKAEIEKVPGVAAACPVLTWTTTIEKVIYVIYGLDTADYESIGGNLRIVSGRPWENSREILVDTRLARANGFDAGDRITLLGREFTVAGIFQSGVGARVYLPLDTLQEALHLQGMCSIFFVKTDADDQAGVVAVVSELESRLPALRANALDRYEDVILNEITGLNEFFSVITATTLVISFLVILLTMYTTIIERTREIGIMRSIGATKCFVVFLVVRESILLCMMGVLSGFLITLGVRLWITHAHPLLTLEISPGWLALAAMLGIGGGLLGALYPGLKAARVDPVEALGYE